MNKSTRKREVTLQKQTKKLSGTKSNNILSFFEKKKINLLKTKLTVILIEALVDHSINCIRINIQKKIQEKVIKKIGFLCGLIFAN